MSIRYLLDTDTCVAWLRGRPFVQQRLTAAGPAALAIAVVTLAELRYGAACSARPTDNHQAIDAFLTGVAVIGLDPTAARIFGEVKAGLRSQGLLLEDADLLVAATALAAQLTLVTNNTQHFGRIPGLTLENWLVS
ncbi:MAG: PIN domain-containing protein [Chloroflexales bacterium]|nr:PIN domain-containing protein [Chloroflexales bacterium]